MLPSAPADPTSLSMDVLFPEEYARSAQAIRSDFVLLGGVIALSSIGIAVWLNLLV